MVLLAMPAALGISAARLELTRLDDLRQLDRLQALVAGTRALGVDDADLAPVAAELPLLRHAALRAHDGAQVDGLAAHLQSLINRVNVMARDQRAENARIAQAARVLLGRYYGHWDAMRSDGGSALGAGRNDATIAAFLELNGIRTKALERYAAMIPSSRPEEAAVGVAGVQRQSGLIHEALLAHAPDRLIVVSLATQRLLAFDHGRLLLDALVTTGRPELPTDIGRMRVIKKDSPWTMQSPWPKGSPYWYPDTPVRMVLWFTRTGEGMHDADWEPASAYGPGSQSGPFASHGCIHVPLPTVTVLYQWAPIGTPVVVYPGDGSPLVRQIAQQSVDAQGDPVSGQPSGI